MTNADDLAVTFPADWVFNEDNVSRLVVVKCGRLCTLFLELYGTITAEVTSIMSIALKESWGLTPTYQAIVPFAGQYAGSNHSSGLNLGCTFEIDAGDSTLYLLSDVLSQTGKNFDSVAQSGTVVIIGQISFLVDR